MNIQEVTLNKVDKDNQALIILKNEDKSFGMYFSYRTLVAFKTIDGKIVARVNAWGNTTERFLKLIGGERLVPEEFYKQLTDAFYEFTR